ncbi:hypothetical protein [Chryseobacterium oryzae]|uniref:Lipoprotein n=1 Tax=Chryseobacterium oryzae TaxID=2929799 RepID=A0ABY4BFF0_9FLAO|nr:hypothetical protein [Chryseobacterium oryzae]UOE37484.1 hypothetical protein MTP08_10440 [Chryseobacterium oryzae]
MKKLSLIVICALGISACNKPIKNTDNSSKQVQSVGNDENDHGCIASAGQTWSELKKDCIQIFNQGFRLNPINSKKGEEVISAFILVSEDQSKVELFLPDNSDHNSIILDKTGKNTYQNNQYKYDLYSSILYVDNIEKYKGNVE